MIKYIHPDRVNRDYTNYNQRSNPPIIHNNVSTYAQALMNFHESNPVPTQASQKRLKLQFNSIYISEKRNYTQEVPQLIQKNSETKSVTLSTKLPTKTNCIRNPTQHSSTSRLSKGGKS